MNCCKLYLVPEEVINTWRAEQRETTVDRPVHSLVTKMDDGLNHILDNQELSEHDKEKLYSQELSRYLAMREKKNPTPVATPSDHKVLLSSIPKTYKTKAEGLLDYLKQDQDVDRDEQGHLYIKQQKVPGSHILDLIHDALRLRKKMGRPTGFQELSSHLRERNVPHELVGNEEWLQSSPPEFSTPPSTVYKSKRAEVEASARKSTAKRTAKQLWKDLDDNWKAVA